MIKRICKQCGREYMTYPSINLYFCSHRCSSKYREGKTWMELMKNGEELLKRVKGQRRSKSTEFKKGWQNTEDGKKMILKRVKKLGSELSKPEKLAVRFIEENNLPFEFVGDGKLIIGTKCPDFIYIGNGKKIIEIYSKYWHREDIVKYWHQTEEGVKLYYELFGYNCLVIWETELKNPVKVIETINQFINSTLELPDLDEGTYNKFVDIANKEFNGNKAFTLKHLLDFYFGKVTEHSLIAEAKADEALERISKIEEKFSAEGTEQKDPKVKKMMDGTERRCF